MYVGRYAPSPTGLLHVGNAFAALVTWARARRAGGRVHLRIEDVDTPRTKPGAAAAIARDLAALGLNFDAFDVDGDVDVDGVVDGVVWQSRRGQAYEHALAELAAAGLLYACSCSRKDLAASAPHVGDEGPVYPGTCRDKGIALDAPDVAWRVRVDRLVARCGVPVVDDAFQGAFSHDVEAAVGDFIVRRKDGLYAYQLAVVVDDHWQRVTEVVRGQDLLASAPRQVLLHRALGGPPPRFAHLPLLVDPRGERIAKRSAEAPDTLAALFARGVTPAQVIGHLARLLGHDVGDVDAKDAIDLFDGQALARPTVVWRPLR